MKIKRIFSLRFAFILFVAVTGRSGLGAETINYVQPFSLNPVNEGIQLGIGGVLSGSALVCDKFLQIKDTYQSLMFQNQ